MSQSRKNQGRIHLQILEDLRGKIRSGAYKIGQRIPPEIELAKTLGVSRGTVRLAMGALVEEGLLQRTPGRGTFVRAQAGSTVDPSPRSRLVGMVVPSLRDKLSTDMISGAEHTLRQNGYSLVFCHSSHDLQIEREQIQQLIDQRVRGIILFPIADAEEAGMVKPVIAQGIPVVSIDRQIPGCSVPTVMADNYGGAYQATEFLLHKGYRRVVCISNTTLASSVSERVRGYEAAMRDEKLLPYAPVLLLGKSTLEADVTPPLLSDEELVMVSHMLGVDERPTAVFCVNDFIAIGVIRFFLACGLRIPEDIAVVGFDDSPFAPFAPVALTTVAQSGVEIGEKAAEALFASLLGQPVADTVLVPTRLIIRKSSG